MTQKVDNVVIMNQYHYTNPLMEEVQDARSAQTYRNLGTIIVLLLITAFFTYREYVTHKMTLCVLFGIIAVGCLIAIIATLVGTKKGAEKAKRAFRDEFKNKGCQVQVMIEASHIRAYRDGKKYADFRRHELLNAFETDRFFVFQAYGEVLIPLKKDAFEEGSLNDCRSYMPDKKEVH
ncbi:MAG: hypothetical protein Q4B75_01590 [Eubacteriales bacterium]|nr:hypothetical protein [Eubacteriales bacterium]